MEGRFRRFEIRKRCGRAGVRRQYSRLSQATAPLTRVVVPDMEPGTYYYLVVDSPDKGIQTPTLLVMTPSQFTFEEPASEVRVGTNINDESVVDFKPAITSQPIKVYYYAYLHYRIN
ncbi:hypothetical protein OESDEN_16562 [Oesophagostomum dentatum]|uniref:Fibronectin type-III domain-containing protein n=1 Tax=Oesophagostomum dentatum TaxID=61180 RepID=A0A0B1SIM7_OESDE|nr:hypothetical protein OESDEN_16562 [Oesophagostomum dentatum]